MWMRTTVGADNEGCPQIERCVSARKEKRRASVEEEGHGGRREEGTVLLRRSIWI